MEEPRVMYVRKSQLRALTQEEVHGAFDDLSAPEKVRFLALHEGSRPYPSKIMRIYMNNTFRDEFDNFLLLEVLLLNQSRAARKPTQGEHHSTTKPYFESTCTSNAGLGAALCFVPGHHVCSKHYRHTAEQAPQILLANKKAGDLGPITCVCYTNHALDQGLEQLVDEGVQKIVRIGGHSKSQRLTDVSLRMIA
ncbi:hypothetical protein LTR17_014407 [Elasticomyces elasticus]|nr:hypothetical protein LTR17_014407 [Elasticomyces elasticus]